MSSRPPNPAELGDLVALLASIGDRLKDLFDGRPWVSHAEAARFLGVADRTLTREAECGAIFGRRRGAASAGSMPKRIRQRT